MLKKKLHKIVDRHAKSSIIFYERDAVISVLKKICSWVCRITTPAIVFLVVFLFILSLLVVTDCKCRVFSECFLDIIAPDNIFRIVFLFLLVLIILRIPGFYNFYMALRKQNKVLRKENKVLRKQLGEQDLKNYGKAVRYYEQVIEYCKARPEIQRFQRLIRVMDNPKTEIAKAMADVSNDDKFKRIPESSYTYYELKNAIFSTDIVAAAYNNIGNIKAVQEKYNEAINNYDEAIKQDSKGVIVYNNRGISKRQRGISKKESGDYAGANSDCREAISDYNRVIELDPEYAKAYYNRGIAKSKLKYYKSAISDYNRAIELDPKYAYAYNNRGNAKAQSGHYESAISDYNRAIELDPKDAFAYENKKEVVIMYFQSAYNQHCIQGGGSNNKISVDGKFQYHRLEQLYLGSNNKISVDGKFGLHTWKVLGITRTTRPASECHKVYFKYKGILDKVMEESPQSKLAKWLKIQR